MSKSSVLLTKWIDQFNDQLWKILVSVKLTLTLLVCLTVFSIVGTIIAQQGTTQVPIDKLYSPSTLKWLHTFGLTDIYHSAGFVFLIFLLATNLISCSIERLPKVWKEAFLTPTKKLILESSFYAHTPDEYARKQKYLIHKMGENVFETNKELKLASLLAIEKTAKRFELIQDGEDSFQILVEKGKYSRLGVYITHLSLLVIFFGAALGSILGFEGVMNVDEGTRQSWITHLKGSNAGLVTMKENGIPVKGFLNLGFEVECEKFDLETYDGERPKAFRSKLNFYENDVLVHSAKIEVNQPTVYKGMTFYQASYNKIGIGGADMRVFRIAEEKSKKVRDPSSEVQLKAELPTGNRAALVSDELTGANKMPKGLRENQTKPVSSTKNPPTLIKEGKLPDIESIEKVAGVRPGELYRVDGNAAFKVLQVEENVMDLGPAVRMQYFETRETKKPREFWVFKNLPGFDFAHRKGSKLHFVLDELAPRYSTGLSVAKDPGVWVVWIGSLILIAALFLALYTFHSRSWVCYSKEEGLYLVGWSNKLFLFEPRFEKFVKELELRMKSTRSI